MTTDLTVRPDAQQLTVLTNEQLSYIAATEFVPPGLRGNLPAILACVATGRALGIADMTALRSIHIIDGKATFSAELMVMLARQRGHSIQGEVADGVARVVGKRADNGDTMTVEWTLAMAERAGLLNKQNWRKYPEAMLWARAVSQLCRELFADCFAGATYVPEELEDTVGGSSADIPGVEPAHTGSVPAAESSGESPPSPTVEIHKAAAAVRGDNPPVDMADPDIPFGDAPVPEHQPPEQTWATAAQKKKLDTLVGQLRNAGVVTTDRVYELAGREAVVGEDGVLHWAPLRDALTKAEASRLIDALENIEVGDTLAVIEQLLLAHAETTGRADATALAIEKARQDKSPAQFAVWMRQQGARLDALVRAAK
jgi:hypothetical protein